MNPIHLLPGFTATPENPSIIQDLRSGRAGIGIRLGLSLAAAPILVAPFMFLYALIEMSRGSIRDDYIALALGLAGAIWCGSLTFIWAGYRRFARVLKTAFAIVGVWIIAIPLCVLADSALRSGEEFLITGIILTASALTIFFVTTCVYRSLGGKQIQNQLGDIAVNCPTCGYSLVGLDACRCPECGQNHTIDQLIAAQDYEAHRPGITSSQLRGRTHCVDVNEPRQIEIQNRAGAPSPTLSDEQELSPDIIPEPS